jgi:hypothetical protein
MSAEAGRLPGRVFLGLVEIAGYYRNLSDGLRRLGVECVFVDLSGNPHGYEDRDRPGAGIRAIERAARAKAAATGVRRTWWALVVAAMKVPLLVWAALRFDTFVLGYRSTFLAYRELPWLHRLGKRIVYCFHGSDARPPYLDGSIMAPERGLSVEACATATATTLRIVRRVDRYADLVVSHPPYGHFHQRPFVSFLALGIPMPGTPMPPPLADDDRPLRVVHAPSHPAAKGTATIRDIVKRAGASGHRIEFVEISGRPHADVLAELRRADLVIDQLYSDTPMAGLAAEAASVGVPAVVAGYESTEIAGAVPDGRLPPTAYCQPDEAYDTVVALAADASERRRLGTDAHRFVSDEWSVEAVARRWLRILGGDVPPGWLADPAAIRHVHGCGLPAARARELIADLAAVAGPAALGLDDKPGLRDALLAFAHDGPG